jgi:CDP-glycerol glycerophosphotransferase (TagB/SpsB family)
MKIDKYNFSHWVLLTRLFIVALAATIIRPFVKKHSLALFYGHKLNGNLLGIFNQATSKSHINAIFMSMDNKYIDLLHKDNIRAINCTKLNSIITIASAKVIITDHGLHALLFFKYFSDAKFIDVWHGIPYKGFDKNDFKLQHTYQEIWVASDFHKKLYVEKFGFNPEKVFPTGYARTDILINNKDHIDFLKEKYQIAKFKKLIAFCPTWKQDDLKRNIFPFNSTQENFLNKLEEFSVANNVAFIIRTHLNSDFNTSANQDSNLYFLDANNFPNSEEILLISDILVCDWSSISFDYLLLKRPTLFLDVPIPFKKGLSISSDYRYGDIALSLDMMFGFLEEYVENEKSYYLRNQERINAAIDTIYNHYADGKSSERGLQRLKWIIEN